LLEQARRLGRHRTKRETVNEALREYIRRRKRLAAARAFGTFDFDAGFDQKRLRRAR
jgi:Arc/MetJ family transcription regulator